MQLYFHRKEYRLTDEQAGKLCWDPEDAMVLMEEGDTVVELIFGLRQGEAGGPFTEGDGMYYVDVNLLWVTKGQPYCHMSNVTVGLSLCHRSPCHMQKPK